MRCLTPLLVVFFTLSLTKAAHSQVVTQSDSVNISSVSARNGATRADSGTRQQNIPAITIAADSISIPFDSLGVDTTIPDSIANRNLEETLGIRISPDALPSVVTSTAKDSAVMDMKTNQFYLYGDAQVNYEELQLNAGQVIFKQDSNVVTAAPQFDSLGVPLARPSFTQGQEKFTYDSMQYNFKSKRAIVRNARTQYGEGFVHSQQIKRNPDQSIYGLHSVYTTCALDTPHFGIRARRIKVIPNKVIASGPANIAIEQVPTPIFLPFGLFPISQGQRSGFKLPMYTIEEARGVGLQQGGYYFAINDHVDFLVTGDVYSRGSYNVTGISSYNNRYRYSGGLSLAYAYNKRGEIWEPEGGINKDFRVDWQHRSDPKSRPGVGFNSSVVFGTSTFNDFNSYTVNQILQNQYQSNISYQKSWQNKPYSLTVAARHSQNNGTRQVDVTLPEINFFVAQFNPFQTKNSTGTRWFEKITASYNLNAINKIAFIDTNFSFNTLALNDFENGLKHNIPISASYNVLRFINMTFGANYNEYWLTKRTYRFYDQLRDTVDQTIYRGFYTARDFNANTTLNTRIYGLKMFKKGKIMGIRHVLTPSTGITFTPDYAASPFHYGYRTITDAGSPPRYFSVYENTIGYTPSQQFGNFSSLLNFGIDNNLQIKVRTDKDSTGARNIRLIDNFSINTAYDLARDSFKWADISMRFATNLFNVLNIQAGAVFDPYDFDFINNRRIDRTMWDAGKGLARFRTANASVGGSLRSITDKTDDGKPQRQTEEYQRLLSYGRYSSYADFNVPWNLTFSYNIQIDKQFLPETIKDTITFNHMSMFSGDVNITPRWKLAVTSGYNFTTKQLSVTQVEIFRDLHCWEMRLSTIPFGPNKNFTFTLNVKAQILQDLRLIRRRDFRDAL